MHSLWLLICVPAAPCCHPLAAPYGKLAALYVGCYIAGYAYNPNTQSIRVYLTRERPEVHPGAGHLSFDARWCLCLNMQAHSLPACDCSGRQGVCRHNALQHIGMYEGHSCRYESKHVTKL
jgi:hypothetical protein